jgi:glycosyltransferase involved in cell wall biosynthesis
MKILKNKIKKISVLVVNYNNCIYLRRCIRSIKYQNFKNIEIIAVDDHSTDNSLEILKKEKKITLIKNKKKTNIGAYDQINAYKLAFLKAKGDLIFFLDSDDFFKRKKINSLLKIINLDQIVSPVYFDLPIFYFNNKNYIKKKFYQKKFILSPWPKFTPQSCICIRKDYLNKIFKVISIKKFPHIWMDFRIAIYTYLKFGSINIVKKYLTFYQQSQSQVSRKYKILSKEWWERRLQAYEYLNFLCKKLNKKKFYTLDFLVTFFINKFLIK